MGSVNMSKVSGLLLAKVKEVDKDELNLNRVKVVSENNRLEIKSPAPVVSSFVGKEFGSVIIPNVGDHVVVGFLDEDLRNPIVLGCVYNKDNKPPIKVDGKNEKMLFKFPSGMTLEIDNKKDEPKIDIKTSQEHHLTLSDKDEKVVLKNKSGDTSLEVDLKGNKIDIKSNEISLETPKCSISLKDNIDIKSDNGNVNVEAKSNVGLKANANLSMEATSEATLKGSNAKVNGNATTEINGAQVKMG